MSGSGDSPRYPAPSIRRVNKMNLDELKLTGVMSAELVKKNISWKKKINDKYKEFKCDVFVKKVSFYDFEKLYIDRN